ncbi:MULTISPECIES: hypothetical protein [Pimelobacter]|uniref:hypothetical protein n=1 Tax=Pimelobacter TaxID=2044 RepID=UPI00207BC0CB|nr:MULTISPECIES: hypothetical protein [Pimelobacter]UUW91905.1 hypothetical protein M0M43_10600 [Pimelobacter simplex]UUW95732.1 hypothetical protein M0M48_29095 [Pimelobacter simplex]
MSERSGRPESDWERKRRLAEVFGDALPETTSDERDDRDQAADRGAGHDQWLKSQVPPHHGRTG